MKALGWKLTVLLIAAAAIAVGLLIYGNDFAANIAFFIAGALIAIVTQLAIELQKRHELQRDLARSLYVELANRVGRCCFDFESPWGAYLERQENVHVSRLLKFAPDPPVIYPAVASQIALLKDDAAQAIIDFYIALAAWYRAIETTVHDTPAGTVLHGPVRLLAERLRRTLPPGERALEALAGDVPDANEIERNALRDADSLFPDAHPNAGKTVRERIKLML